jgi:hypothetical protein
VNEGDSNAIAPLTSLLGFPKKSLKRNKKDRFLGADFGCFVEAIEKYIRLMEEP